MASTTILPIGGCPCDRRRCHSGWMGVAALGWHLQRVGGRHAHRRFARANGLPMGLCLQAAVTIIDCPYKQSGALQANHVSDAKDALTPLSPSTPSPPSLSLRRWWLPLPLAAALPRGDNPGGRPFDVDPCGRPAADPFCGRSAARGCRPYGGNALLVIATLASWPWPRHGRGWPALHGG
ncbi:hypothetical protein B296_00046290 [Ensete ventricosum]|uniref:Uncharacterized protein n=1 Tax=Ensete ventricosum TaxID=4639 RepID=A0A426WZX1_ENSVE|nr:hypothetical protein B296_00046290 [Ensete ventricosum]